MFWDYAFFEYYLSLALLTFAMFGMGTTLAPRDFIRVARAPRAVLLVLAMQVLVTPCVAIILSRTLSLPRGVTIGLLLVAALPGGLFSNLLTFLGRGNLALSITATVQWLSDSVRTTKHCGRLRAIWVRYASSSSNRFRRMSRSPAVGLAANSDVVSADNNMPAKRVGS